MTFVRKHRITIFEQSHVALQLLADEDIARRGASRPEKRPIHACVEPSL